MKLSTILLTTDLSETSRRAVDPARELARRFGAELVLAFVDDDRLPPLALDYMAVGSEELRDRQHEQSIRNLRVFATEELGESFSGRIEIPFGVPHVEIVRLAQSIEADLIVMATHGRGFVSHAIMGSTTERVLRRSPCPVLVVPGHDDSSD